MGSVHSGMSAVDLGTEGWEKPWSGTNGGSCVEAKRLPDGSVAFRQSRDPEGPALVYSRDEMIAFLQGAKSGQADFLIA
ncbi:MULTISPECIES: DUF397 domain-containing protein [Streptomyces]|uniref:DUF397 domain-containing protein n=2 Tax=Streptomyces TaxID=1883 RepID=A0AB39RZ98_9ACTN|nr:MULTISPECIES: DUF397 domain-containing protein [unclassified Streptomyces]WSP68583.1 DUF397 domain-containing protein [Streptomyces sp. NBC_01236]WTI41726.1 DUF397 domain-containing protein [Streptomyces sp. NBC_00775]WUB24591.1 DUF397 domain-containing protein [Streptomyces sp. NBC_00589]